MEHSDAAIAEVSVLGPIQVRMGSRPVDLGTPRQRSIMAALALSRGRPVEFDVIVDRVWGEAAPATAVATLQRYVASLRQALASGRDPQGPSLLVTAGAAYALSTGDDLDVDRFADGVAEARRLLQDIPDPLRPVVPHGQVERVARAVRQLDEVLLLWRGEPYADLGELGTAVVAERARLHDLHTEAEELRLIALLALGRHVETLGDLLSRTSLQPLHERWWALRAVALVRSGRQAEALEALADVRQTLAEELGVDPSPPLQALYDDILRQAPSLMWRGARGVEEQESRPRPRPRASRTPAGPLWPLMARDAEAAALAVLLAETGNGAFRSALVTGETGIGKTRLVEEIVQRAQASEVAVAVARCTEHAPALWPFRSAFAALGPDPGVPDDLEALRTRLGDFATWRAVADALCAAAADVPLLLVVEDVQNAHPDTLRLLEHLVADRGLPGVALVLTRRTHEGDDIRHSKLAAAVARSAGLRIDLEPLGPIDARALALAVEPHLPDAADVARRSGGNPFFVTELARARGRVGGGLADVVRTRVASLGDAPATVLGLASTVDGCFDVELLATLLQATAEQAEAALTTVLQAGLLRRGDRASDYVFVHDVVREVLRSDLPVLTVSRCRALEAGLSRRRAGTASGTRRLVRVPSGFPAADDGVGA